MNASAERAERVGNMMLNSNLIGWSKTSASASKEIDRVIDTAFVTAGVTPMVDGVINTELILAEAGLVSECGSFDSAESLAVANVAIRRAQTVERGVFIWGRCFVSAKRARHERLQHKHPQDNSDMLTRSENSIPKRLSI